MSKIAFDGCLVSKKGNDDIGIEQKFTIHRYRPVHNLVQWLHALTGDRQEVLPQRNAIIGGLVYLEFLLLRGIVQIQGLVFVAVEA
ncbi:hypothetical protein GFS31_04430 [Leptolyngbya sp. BL0902]|nr:hypothetical protein GFS31_04430 [Leptolyngbya sp. BL0902]